MSMLFPPQIKLVNINIPDIIDGKPSIVLGLIWTIILQYHVSFRALTEIFSLIKTNSKQMCFFSSRLRSWPVASRSALVSRPWSLLPVWTLVPPCQVARPAAALFLAEARRCTTASGFQPRRHSCSGSVNSVTSMYTFYWDNKNQQTVD